MSMSTGCNTSSEKMRLALCMGRVCSKDAVAYSKSTDRKLVGDLQEIERNWRDVFQEFQETGDFNGDFIDFIQFCFLKIIQNELDTVVTMWDNLRIRAGGNGHPNYHGKPCLMYNVHQDLHPLQYERVGIVLQEDICLWKTDIPCDQDLHVLCLIVMEENNIAQCHNATEAIRLYKDLRPLTTALVPEPHL